MSLTRHQRLNHNCKPKYPPPPPSSTPPKPTTNPPSPSCITRFSQRTLALEVVAYRDIAPGEELTHSCKPPPTPFPNNHPNPAPLTPLQTSP